MSMIEKFKERKKMMDANVERIEKEAFEKVDKEATSFTEDFESLAQSASDEEFSEFMRCNDESIDAVDRMAAIAMRSHRPKPKRESENDFPNIIVVTI